MWPFILLFVFLGLAFAAIAVFVALTLKNTDVQSRRDDWKRFLSSFSGTSFALSVGFISFMLQQHTQNSQRYDQESDQIRARLVYSMIQNQIINTARFSVFNIGDRLHANCFSDDRQEVKEAAFMRLKSDMATALPKMKETIDRLSSSGTLPQNTIIKLLEQTNLASRIDPGLARAMSKKELLLALHAPDAYGVIFDPGFFETREVFCKRVQDASRGVQDVLFDSRMLQIYACAAYVTVGLGPESSVDISGQFTTSIDGIEEIAKRSADALPDTLRTNLKVKTGGYFGSTREDTENQNRLLKCVEDIATIQIFTKK